MTLPVGPSEQHFSEVVQGEEFLSLSLQQVCSLIASDKLTVSTEEKVRPRLPSGETMDPCAESVLAPLTNTAEAKHGSRCL